MDAYKGPFALSLSPITTPEKGSPWYPVFKDGCWTGAIIPHKMIQCYYEDNLNERGS